jgi:hypothetical protein
MNWDALEIHVPLNSGCRFVSPKCALVSVSRRAYSFFIRVRRREYKSELLPRHTLKKVARCQGTRFYFAHRALVIITSVVSNGAVPKW